jgi:hypothetical protein
MKCSAGLAAGLVDGSNDDRLSDFTRVPGLALRSGAFFFAHAYMHMYESRSRSGSFTRCGARPSARKSG